MFGYDIQGIPYLRHSLYVGMLGILTIGPRRRRQASRRIVTSIAAPNESIAVRDSVQESFGFSSNLKYDTNRIHNVQLYNILDTYHAKAHMYVNRTDQPIKRKTKYVIEKDKETWWTYDPNGTFLFMR